MVSQRKRSLTHEGWRGEPPWARVLDSLMDLGWLVPQCVTCLIESSVMIPLNSFIVHFYLCTRLFVVNQSVAAAFDPVTSGNIGEAARACT